MEDKKIIRTKSKVLAKYKHNGHGIVTGPHNPISVGCVMYVLESGESATFFTLKKWHQGHEMLAHGGITASILDEVMGYSNHTREYKLGLGYTPVFTGTATYKYIRPVVVGETYYAFARVNRIEGFGDIDDRKRFITGEIVDEEGNVYVKGESIFLTAGNKVDSREIVMFDELNSNDPVEL